MAGSPSQKNPFRAAFGLLPFIVIVSIWWPEILPWDSAFSIWVPKGSLAECLTKVWWLFAYAVGINLFFSEKRRNLPNPPTPNQILYTGFRMSLAAGIVEEILFRWLLFLGGIVIVSWLNLLFFGWAGFGVPEWLHLNLWGPIANWITLGALQDWIFHERGWQVGAALIYSNAFFRDGHKYQGTLGWINSWFIGIVFFWVAFNYGLVTAMAVHFLYDFTIFGYLALERGHFDEKEES